MDVYELIEIAKDCGCSRKEDTGQLVTDNIELGKFAAAIADKIRDETNERANASWSLMCKKMVAFEREAIIQIIKETPFSNWYQADVIEAIKKRGEINEP